MISEMMIEARKQFSRMLSKGRSTAKLDRCLWCGKQISHFCESHTIPQMILKNISQDGKLDYVRGSYTERMKTADHGQFSVNISKLGITKGQH